MSHLSLMKILNDFRQFFDDFGHFWKNFRQQYKILD